MFKAILIIAVVISLLIAARFYMLGTMSKSGKPPGLVGGRLTPCPDSPNCVVSEIAEGDSHAILPIHYPAAMTGSAMNALKHTIQKVGGKISIEEEAYMAATFTSKLFGFADDLEVRHDRSNHTIHLRSASRVGHSDFGANRKRVELISSLFQEHAKSGPEKMIRTNPKPSGYS